MTRPSITLTAAEWASVQDGTLWLVREGESCLGCGWPASGVMAHSVWGEDGPPPPAVFVRACAPCETCGGSRCVVPPDCDCDRVTSLNYALCTHPPADCTDCRIELVGPCEIDGCRWSPHRTLGHAYAIGQPLPIVDDTLGTGDCLIVDPDGDVWVLIDGVYDEPITAALAHYGPPETLVGRWAIQLRVVGP